MKKKSSKTTSMVHKALKEEEKVKAKEADENDDKDENEMKKQ